MRHGVLEIEMNDDLNFSAMVHSDKQISRQISTIVFSNALVEALLVKLGDSALYVLFGSDRKTKRITARSMLFSNAAGGPVCFTLSPQLRISTREIQTVLFRMPVGLLP